MRTTMLAAVLCACAVAGCDRPEAPKTAAQQPAPAVTQGYGAPQPDARTRQEPPAQGQVDSRQPEQKREFDSKG